MQLKSLVTLAINASYTLLASLLLISCAVNAPIVGGGKVSYGDTNAIETVNTDFGSTDLNIVAQEMAHGLISSNIINKCETYTISPVRNKTDQYIDTENITQSIANILSNSPQVKSLYVLSSQELANQVSELERQSQPKLYNNNSTAKPGKMRAAQCRIDGYVANITKENSSIKDVFYIFNLKLINIEEGTQLWNKEKQIRKDMTR